MTMGGPARSSSRCPRRLDASGVMDGLALTISLGLQYGVPLKVFVDKLLNTRFEPSGITANANIRFVSSVLDYIARWLADDSSPRILEVECRGPGRMLLLPLRRHASTNEQSCARCDADGVVRAKAEQRPRGRAYMQRVRHADGAERRML